MRGSPFRASPKSLSRLPRSFPHRWQRHHARDDDGVEEDVGRSQTLQMRLHRPILETRVRPLTLRVSAVLSLTRSAADTTGPGIRWESE